MKIFQEKDYKYIGQRDGWHCFESIKENFDPEIVLVRRARFIHLDGSSEFFDPLEFKIKAELAIQDCFRRRRDRISSMCVINPAKVKCNPKRSVAVSDDAVNY